MPINSEYDPGNSYSDQPQDVTPASNVGSGADPEVVAYSKRNLNANRDTLASSGTQRETPALTPLNYNASNPTLDPNAPPPVPPSNLWKPISEDGHDLTLTPPLDPVSQEQADRFNAIQAQMFEVLNKIQPPLTPAQKNEMEFAYYHPNLIPPAPGAPYVAALVALGLPAPEKTISGECYDQMVANGKEINYQKLLLSDSSIGELTGDEINQLQYAHLYGDANLPANLKQIHATLEAQNKKAVQEMYGMPAEWTIPAPAGHVFNDTVNGALQIRMLEALEKFAAQSIFLLSADQKSLLMAAVKNPDSSNPMNATAQQLINEVLEAVQKEFSLPSGWQHVVTGASTALQALAPMTPRLETGLNALNFADNAVTTIKESSGRIIDPLLEMSTLNLLKIISLALVNAKASLFAQEVQKERIQATVTKAQQEYNQAKIEIQVEQAAAAKAAYEAESAEQKKSDTFSFVMKIVGPVMIALSAVAAIATGGAAGVLLIVAIAFTVADSQVSQMHLLQKMFTAIDGSLAKAGYPFNTTGFRMFVKAALVIAIAIAVPGPAGDMMGMYAFMNSNLSSDVADQVYKYIVQPLAHDFGHDLGPSAMTEMIINVVFTVVASLAFAVAAKGAATTTLSKAEEAVASTENAIEDAGPGVIGMIKKVFLYVKLAIQRYALAVARAAEAIEESGAGQALSKVLAPLTKIMTNSRLQTVLQTTIAVSGVANASLGMTKALVDKNIAEMQAALTLLSASFDAKSKQLQATIDELDALIKQLQQMINNMIGDISTIGDVQVNMYRDLQITPS